MERKPPTSRWTVRRAVTVLAVMAALVPAALVVLSGVKLDNRVETWLPAEDPDAMVLEWFHDRFGDQAGLLVSWDGSSLNDPRVEAFAAELAGPPNEEGIRTQPIQGIDGVRTPRDLIRRMIEQDVERPAAIRELMGVVVGAGPLKVELTPDGKSQQDQVVDELRARAKSQLGIDVIFLTRERTQQPLPASEETDEEVFQEETFSGPGADDPYPPAPSHDFQIRWAGMTPQSETTQEMIELCENLKGNEGQPLVQDCFFAPGSPVAVMVTLSEKGDEEVERTLDAIRAAAQRAGVPEADFHMGGSPYGRSELNKAAEASLWNPEYPAWMLHKRSPVILSGLVGIGMAFLVLRSARLATLVLLTDLFVALITTALLPATGHALNMVLIVLPNLLIVLTSSGAIHIANYWRHEAVKGMEGAVSRAVKIAWKPCMLASLTTAIGLTSLLTSVLRPVREFGTFASIGCLVTLAAILLGFPSMLRLWRGQTPSTADVDRSHWRRLGGWLYRHSTIVTVASVVLYAAGFYGLQWFRTETKVIRYFQPQARIVQDYEFLEENLAGVAPVEVVISFDEDVLGREPGDDDIAFAEDDGEDFDNVEEEAEVGAAAVPILNSVERMELVRKIQALVAAHPDISGTLALSDFRPPMELPGPDASPRELILFNRTAYSMDEFLQDAGKEGNQGLVAINELPLKTPFGERMIDIPAGAELWRIRAQVALMTDLDYGELTSELDQIIDDALSGTPGTTHAVTGMVPLFLRTQNAVVESLVESFGLAFAVIAIVMMILLRNPLAGLITMIPNVLPVVFVFGAISWAGVPVDIGTMITASVALGIAVDDSLHQLTWFRNGIQHGLSRQEAISLGLAHSGPAMSQTSAAIGFGLLMLSWADLLLVSRFGWLMSAMIVAALMADIILLPALLAGPLGALIERNVPRPSEKSELPPSAEPRDNALRTAEKQIRAQPVRSKSR